MQILGIANSYASAPVNAPTSLSAVASTTSVAISFTAPTNDGGAAITNYQYNVNGGSFIALSPADATSPVTISGLTSNTSTTITLRAVNIVGAGPASAGVTFTTLRNAPAGVHFLVVAGGAGPGGQNTVGVSGGGGGGGFRTSYGTSGRSSAAEATLTLTNTSYTVSIGGGGGLNASGGNSQFAGIVSTGGGKGGTDPTKTGTGGGSGGGGGCGGTGTFAGGAGIAGQGGNGFEGYSVSGQFNRAGCGGGASGNAGADVGGAGLTSTISGSTQGYSGGGRGGRLGTTGSTDGTYSGTGYYGGGGHGVTGASLGAQGVVIIRYSTSYDLPVVSGLTYSATTSGADRIITFTGGTGTVTW
jgi:hypothetical protein